MRLACNPHDGRTALQLSSCSDSVLSVTQSVVCIDICAALHITGWAVVQAMCWRRHLVPIWESQKFAPHSIETPDVIEIEFSTVDYVGEATPGAKFHANPSFGASRQMVRPFAKYANISIWCRQYHLLWFLLFLMCKSLNAAVKKCINCCFVHLLLLYIYYLPWCSTAPSSSPSSSSSYFVWKNSL